MHFEILVEGQCELTVLSTLMPKFVGVYNSPHTWRIHKHRGIGAIPSNPDKPPKINDTSLLGQLPAKLRAYSKNPNPNRKVIILMDLDDKDRTIFTAQLNALLVHCDAEFTASFSFAEEEPEAWYLGDRNALLVYNPKIATQKLDAYVQDSICNTWKLLLDADDPSLSKINKRDRKILEKKVLWAKKISPHMNTTGNLSPSFNDFKLNFN
ncbi:hypothetical protein [Pantoea agglomerans]|uniref:hypothetical protein n=1 Tax=Enterobacter agglomerans TaxID=549 RepID=UPI00057E72E0|nr:hypothetical protein [Pantoea agglomerans]KIC85725.1 hypothetical protein RN49_17485 [Pantoea agglomerans]